MWWNNCVAAQNSRSHLLHVVRKSSALLTNKECKVSNCNQLLQNTYGKELRLLFFMLQEFETYLRQEKRYSAHTCLAYIQDLEQYAIFAECEQLSDWQQQNSAIIRSWMVQLLESGLSNRTVNRKLASLRTFLGGYSRRVSSIKIRCCAFRARKRRSVYLFL